MLLEPVLSVSRSLKLAVLGCAVLAGGCDRQSGEKAQPQASASASAPASGAPEALTGKIDRSHKGSLLPDFTMTDAAGSKLRLTELKGKPVLVNLWATWCAPCVTELPTLNALSNRADAGVRVVTISQDTTGPDKVQAFLDARGFAQLPAWVDAKGDLPIHYQVNTLPTTIYYDAAGKEVWRFVGGHDWGSAETAKMLAEGA